MAQRDKIHDAVKNALIKDGWRITHDPYQIRYKDVRLYTDLGAERTLGAERGNEKIAVEIKSFLTHSPLHDFGRAMGQYLLYKTYMAMLEPERHLYLAISEFAYQKLFQQQQGLEVAQKVNQISILVIDIVSEEVVQWLV